MAKKNISVSLEEEFIEVLDEISEQTGENRSQVLERLTSSAIHMEAWGLLPSVRNFFDFMASPAGSRKFLEFVRDDQRERMSKHDPSTMAKKTPLPKAVSLTKDDPKLPAKAKRDPHGPPKKSRQVVCVHCLKTSDSNALVWDGNMWLCPHCKVGAGYGYDLVDADTEFGRGIREQAGIEIE